MEETIKQIKEIYHAFSDDESKDIFINRLLYNISGEETYIDNIVKEYVIPTGINEMGVIKYLLYGMDNYSEDFYLVVYGCGEMGEKINRILGEKILCFCDKSIEKQNNGFCDKKVISPDELIAKKNEYRVIIGSIDYYYEIYHELKSKDIQLAYDNYEMVSEWLKIVEEQYFAPDIIHYDENEVFVDGGCLNLFTVKQLLKRCSTVKKVYAFEPDQNSYIRCNEEAQKISGLSYEIIQKGLYDSNTELCFHSMGNGCSGIDEQGECKISVCSLDSEIEDRVTFIKMDIEGVEMEALKGAQDIIRKYKPKLAICVYHKPEDIYQIPQYILRLNSDYKLYLRHYSDNAGETVLYAV